MTNPYVRPDEPGLTPDGSSQDETIPLVPESGYSSRPSPWSEGTEQTTVDPLGQGYTNPNLGGDPYRSSGQPQQNPQPQQYPQPQAYPPPGYSAPGYQQPAATYEQPPAVSGYGPYEPAQEPAPAPMVPSYPAGAYQGNGYQAGGFQIVPTLPDHPNAIASFVLAVVGFIVGVTFPIAWYMGAKGNAEVKRNPGRWRNSPLMTAGMIIGAIGTILMVLGFGLFVLVLIFAIASS